MKNKKRIINKNKILKKSQFYIMTTAILCLATYTAVSTLNIEEKKNDIQFNDVAQNFIIEAQRVVNHAIYYNHNITYQLQKFEDDFTQYLDSINSRIGIIYILHNNNQLLIKNSYKKTITAYNGFEQTTIVANSKKTLPLTNDVILTLDNTDYDYYFNIDKEYELKILLIKEE